MTQFDEAPEGLPLVIDDMSHMHQFVFDFYKQKVESLMNAHGVSAFM